MPTHNPGFDCLLARQMDEAASGAAGGGGDDGAVAILNHKNERDHA